MTSSADNTANNGNFDDEYQSTYLPEEACPGGFSNNGSLIMKGTHGDNEHASNDSSYRCLSQNHQKGVLQVDECDGTERQMFFQCENDRSIRSLSNPEMCMTAREGNLNVNNVEQKLQMKLCGWPDFKSKLANDSLSEY